MTHPTRDIWNVSKIKVLKTLARMGTANPIMLAESTRKSVSSIDSTVKSLVKYKYVKTIHWTKKNDGCCNRYALTPNGKEFLSTLDSRFIYGNNLHLKYHANPVRFSSETMQWKKRSYPPSFVECSGNEYEFILYPQTKDDIIFRRLRELTFFSKQEKPYAKGDYFTIYFMDTFVIYFVEKFTLEEYASVFSKYRTPKDPGKYLLKLQSDHPGSQFVYLLYFKKYKQRPQERTPKQRIAQFIEKTNHEVSTAASFIVPVAAPDNPAAPILAPIASPKIQPIVVNWRPIENAPQQAHYSLFDVKIGEVLSIKGINYQVLETSPITLGEMSDTEYRSSGYNSPQEYLKAWLGQRNATLPTKEWTGSKCILQAVETAG